MNKSIEEMTEEEVLAELKRPLPLAEGDSEPDLNAYLERLDELFGKEWEQDVQATASGVRCEITLNRGGFYFLKRSAIAHDTIYAFKMCCHMLGMGRSQTSFS